MSVDLFMCLLSGVILEIWGDSRDNLRLAWQTSIFSIPVRILVSESE